MKRILLLIIATLFLAAPSLAQEYDASGTWYSSSGNVFYIPYSDDSFEIGIGTPQGKSYRGHGQWVLKGQSFTYTVDGFPGQQSYVEYDAENDALKVTGPNGVQYWTRGED